MEDAHFDLYAHRLERNTLAPAYVRLLAKLHLARDSRITVKEKEVIEAATMREWTSPFNPYPREWIEY
jgi:hypothetical protein